MPTIKETLEGVHWHFTVLAGDEAVENGKDVLRDFVSIDILEADTEEQALELAKGRIKRGAYKVQQARQCSQCGMQKQILFYLENMNKKLNDGQE